MKTSTWIGGFLGWIVLGPIGAAIGAWIGSMIGEDDNNGSFSGNNAYSTIGGPAEEGNRNSFLMSMLVLASYIIKADGRIMHSEMELVRQWLRANFGEVAVQQGDQILRRLFEASKLQGEARYRQNIKDACLQISMNMDYSERLQLLGFLVMIAQADGVVDATEVAALKEVAEWMQVSADEIDTMLNLGHDDLESAYKVLGVSPEATDDDLRRAYRRLALEHHPDRVAALGEDVRRAAEKKFQEINDAKERIWKARGL
ncbi:MAG: DnaJ domain-containing protein [Prevotella sp.]|nr:DnaJ domain-containing protein [Prevotella sp.]